LIQQAKLEDLIREKIPLGSPDSHGFYSLKCQCCNDYKVRAGFKFESGSIGYNCWNCSTASRFEEFSGRISKKMRGILNDYGIDDTEISAVVNSAFFNKEAPEEKITLKSLGRIDTSTPEVQLPPKSFKIGHPDFIEHQVKLVSYLVGRRVNIDKYPFYFSLDDRHKNSVIIPFYRNGKLIYWQSRSTISLKGRYDNAAVGREAVMFNFDELYRYSKSPLFITEGVFDAMVVDGLSILGSKLSPAKAKLLEDSLRRKIFVIDKDKNGRSLAMDVINRGYEIAFSPEGTSDLNHSFQRFGSIWTVQQLLKSIPAGKDAAQLAINNYCRG
jgi:hypothetical protein